MKRSATTTNYIVYMNVLRISRIILLRVFHFGRYVLYIKTEATTRNNPKKHWSALRVDNQFGNWRSTNNQKIKITRTDQVNAKQFEFVEKRSIGIRALFVFQNRFLKMWIDCITHLFTISASGKKMIIATFDLQLVTISISDLNYGDYDNFCTRKPMISVVGWEHG